MKKDDIFLSILDTVGNGLQAAEQYGLIDEVVATIFVLTRENPSWTIDEIIGEALKEWDL